MGGLGDGISGLCSLLWLLLKARGRLRSRYWAWRRETAFGAGPTPSPGALLGPMWDYARWVGRMRRIRKSRLMSHDPV